MDAFINVIRKDPEVRVKINDLLERHMRLPYKYQARVGYEYLIQNVILRELINIMGTTITDLDIELNVWKIKLTHKSLKESGNHLYLKSCGDS